MGLQPGQAVPPNSALRIAIGACAITCKGCELGGMAFGGSVIFGSKCPVFGLMVPKPLAFFAASITEDILGGAEVPPLAGRYAVFGQRYLPS
jgi:hypothetical protein